MTPELLFLAAGIGGFLAGRLYQWVRDVSRGIGPKRDGGQR